MFYFNKFGRVFTK